MSIWDLHCHLPTPRLKGSNLTEQIGHMLEIAGRVGIEKVGVFLRPDTRGGSSDQEILDALERYRGRAFGFVWCDLFEVQRSIELLQQWVGEGPMIGLKLGGYSGICSKPEYLPVFRTAIDLQAVIYQHTWIKLGGEPPWPGGGNLPHESTPQDLVQLAAKFPEYPFICGHSGGNWELGIRAVRSSPNISVEIGGGFPTAGFVELAVRELGAERVIYGSDVPGRSFSTQLSKVYGAGLSPQAQQRIFHDNLRQMMLPILRRKRIPVE